LEGKKVKKRLEDAAVVLIRNHLLSECRESKVDGIFVQDRVMEKVNEAKTDKEAYALLEEFEEVCILWSFESLDYRLSLGKKKFNIFFQKCKAAEETFRSALTDAVVKRNPIYASHQEELNEIFSGENIW